MAAKIQYADLHVHSQHSDGTYDLAKIFDEAWQNKVGLLSICDHNTAEANAEMEKRCYRSGIKYVRGVEIDAVDNGKNIHVLAYNFDADNADFLRFLEDVKNATLMRNVKLVQSMADDGLTVSAEEYEKFDFDPAKGGWKFLQYAVEKGLADRMGAAKKLYAAYNVGYDGYPTVIEVCKQIKKAGGASVLAHPGNYFDDENSVQFAKDVQKLVKQGFDGMECYYSYHSTKATQICLDLCMKHKLMITAGSDCHGTIASAKVGEMKIPVSSLELKKLSRPIA
jgi:predicted metal-dependent phosphoesterase TrpH